MAIGSDFFWKLFQASGHVGAYLLYTDYRKLQQGGDERDEHKVEQGEEAVADLVDREAAPAMDEGSWRP